MEAQTIFKSTLGRVGLSAWPGGRACCSFRPVTSSRGLLWRWRRFGNQSRRDGASLGSDVRLEKGKHVLFPSSDVKVQKMVTVALRVAERGIDLSHVGL